MLQMKKEAQRVCCREAGYQSVMVIVFVFATLSVLEQWRLLCVLPMPHYSHEGLPDCQEERQTKH